MLENLGKTVIITGSQIPIFETRTDGKDNFISGLILAGNYLIPGNLPLIWLNAFEQKMCSMCFIVGLFRCRGRGMRFVRQ